MTNELPMTPNAVIARNQNIKNVYDRLYPEDYRYSIALPAAKDAIAMANRVVELEKALSFYANGDHIAGDNYDHTSPVFKNYTAGASGGYCFYIEDGALAQAALKSLPKYICSKCSSVWILESNRDGCLACGHDVCILNPATEGVESE